MFEIKCPCCGASLLIDEHSKRIASHATVEDAAKSAEERFADKLDKVRRDKAGQDQKYEAAQEKERARKERLASLFDQASKKVKEEGPGEKPPERVWD